MERCRELDFRLCRLLAEAKARQMCTDSFYEFVQFFWDVIIPEKPVWNWHIKYLCEELQTLAGYIVRREAKPYDLIINIPPGTTKSTIATVMFPAWIWTQDPTIRVITNSYSAALAIEHATKSRDIIMSDKYRSLFPHILIRRDKAAKSSYENTSGGARYATSTGGMITGIHGHLIINDDPLNPGQAASEVERKAANDHTTTLASRKVDKANTPIITIMQRLHENDVTGYLLAKKAEKIRHICLPAELSSLVSPAEIRKNYINGLLDPVRLSRKILDEQLIDLGSRGYSGQYDQNPVADGGNIVKREWFRRISYADFMRLKAGIPVTFFADTAYTEKKENDPTGIIGTCKVRNDLYILCAKKVRYKFPELIRFLPTYVREHGYTAQSTIRIEPKANGLSVVDQLKESTRLNITCTPSPVDSKETRLNAASPKVECGRVILVDGPWNEEFIEEICGFPAKEHDEYVDLLFYAVDYHLNSDQGISAQELANII
jgi:predicted phage terminase large subunit-like protein